MKKKSPYKLMLINMLVFTLILVNIVMWPKIISYLNPEEERVEVTAAGSAAGKDQSTAESSSEDETAAGEEQKDSSGDPAQDKDIFKIVEIK
ncbi:hypothetical protein FZD47_10750 [Bacillus infantis]|uniref:Uncharacterized protein n=1 Tax=Bacillus infantis TaxID=324767 RepID=A0A5D4SL49_9BACI|nr:hypothetical protein [Bacillus infantis]TYS63973.1 hypothetical protein FZD47_10750 [Bacillus infantis]